MNQRSILPNFLNRIIMSRVFLNGIYFLKLVFGNRRMLLSLAATDFRKHYLSSYLGLFWAIIHPIATTSIMWFVFQLAFKAKPVNEVPFILWLISGLFPWFYFSDAAISSTSSLIEHDYLIKKMVFPIGTLPIVKILSSVLIHFVFLSILIILLVIYGAKPSWYWFQLPYYTFALSVFLLGLSWVLSSLTVFIRDISQIVSMSIQIGFWATPLLWSPDLLADNNRWIADLNPIYYIINGYRGSLLFEKPILENPAQILYFWIFTTVLLFLGSLTFQKLKPHFADVL